VVLELRLAHFCQFGGVLLPVLQNLQYLPGRPISTNFAPNQFFFSFQINTIVHLHLCNSDLLISHIPPVTSWLLVEVRLASFGDTRHLGLRSAAVLQTCLGVLSPPVLDQNTFSFVFRSTLSFNYTSATLT
jgi:hypothetical protein